MPKVWRVRMRSLRPDVKHAEARRFAIRKGIVGTGWGITKRNGSITIKDKCKKLEEYLKYSPTKYKKKRGFKQAVNAFGRRMEKGDYCWTYDPDTGEYWCGQVNGDFIYRSRRDFHKHDFYIVRRCKWKRAGTADDVPGGIIRAFCGPFGIVSRIINEEDAAILASRSLHEPGADNLIPDLFEAAGPDDLEDLVALYLQNRGWRIIPSTAKVSMASYEFVVVHRDGRRAGVQVKSGKAGLRRQAVAEDFDLFFVFTADGDANVPEDPRIRCITRQQIEKFARRNKKMLPRRVQRWWNCE